MSLYYSSATLTNCTFLNNKGLSEGAGGLWCRNSSPILLNCVFNSNSTPDVGGGMQCFESSATLINCTFVNNSAFEGGGLAVLPDSSLTLINCTFFGDSAYSRGGAIFLGFQFTPSDVEIENTIIAFSTGEAVFINTSCDTSSLFSSRIFCSNFYGNTGGDWTGCIEGGDTINGNMSQNPLFCDTTSGDLSLAVHSPCLPAYNTCGVLIGAFEQGCETPVGINNENMMNPNFVLLQNYPNPFNPRTTILYSIPENSHVRLAIYDVHGRLIKILKEGKQSEGEHRASWDGRDGRGDIVGSGVYFVRLEAGDQLMGRKIVLLK